MGLESATTIAGLDVTFPTSSDPRSEGDDHIRLIKSVLKATFAGPSGLGFGSPITAKPQDISAVFTTNVKTCFHMAAAPVGWVQDVNATYANRMMRVINSAGGGVGGTHSPILNTIVPNHTHAQQGTFTSGVSNQSLNHAHSITIATQASANDAQPSADAGVPVWRDGSTTVGSTAADLTGHNHNVTISGSTSAVNAVVAPSTAVGSWQPLYMDLILCVKS